MTHIVERIAVWLVGPAVGCALLLDRLAYNSSRRIKIYEPPAEWVGEEETRPLAAVGLGIAAGSPTTPAAVVAPAPPPDGTPVAPPTLDRGPHQSRCTKHGRHCRGSRDWLRFVWCRLEVAV